MKDNIINEKEYYKVIGLRGFDYKIFEEEDFGGVREEFYGCPYLKHMIQFLPVDWFK